MIVGRRQLGILGLWLALGVVRAWGQGLSDLEPPPPIDGEAGDWGLEEGVELDGDEVARPAKKGLAGKQDAVVSVPVRRYSKYRSIDPISRNGVPYHEDWTIQSGALFLRLPALEGWEAVRPSSDYYRLQSLSGEPGNHLASVLTSERFRRSSGSKFPNFYALIWVPQEYAFAQLSDATFSEFKQGVHSELVEQRQAALEREAFKEFDNYQNFRMGDDEKLTEGIDGYLVRVEDREDLVTYFATSEFIFQTKKTELRQPMIMTITYALVRGKLIRFDFRRLYTQDEDTVQLIAFAHEYIASMRQLNGVGERKPWR